MPLTTAFSLDPIATASNFLDTASLGETGEVIYASDAPQTSQVWRSTAEVEFDSSPPTDISPAVSTVPAFDALDASDQGDVVGVARDEYWLWSAGSGAAPQRLVSDVDGPTASLEDHNVSAPTDAIILVVAYTDEYGVNDQTFDGADLQVVDGEGNSLANVQFDRVAQVDRDAGWESWRVIYQVGGPGGSWDASDNGSYEVLLNPGQVSDRAQSLQGAHDDGNFARPKSLGSISVNIVAEELSESPPAEALGAVPTQEPRPEAEGENDPPIPTPIKANLHDLVSINNPGVLAFAARDPAGVEHVAFWNGSSLVAAASVESRPDQIDLADTGDLLVQLPLKVAGETRGEIRLYDRHLSSLETIAPADEFSLTALATISDDGQVIAFGAVSRAENPQGGIWVNLASGHRHNDLLFGSLGVAGSLLSYQSWTDINLNGELDAYEVTSPLGGVSAGTIVVGSRLLDDASDFTIAWSGSYFTHGTLYSGVIASTIKYDPVRHDFFMGDPTLVAGFAPKNGLSEGVVWPESLAESTGLAPSDFRAMEVRDINAAGQVLFEFRSAGASGGQTTLARATPYRRPLLFLHGIFGSFPTENVRDWLVTRGAPPEAMALDPLARAYDSFVEWLGQQGYELGRDLYIVIYDWRLPLAPLDGAIDGQVQGVTASSISDGVWEYGLDYLGAVLKQAAQNWAAEHNGRQLDMVDVIAHSMGGLLARSYVQSTAYGGAATGGVRLPKLDSLITVGTPHAGAAKAWNPLNNNFGGDSAYKRFFRPMLRAVLRKVENGGSIQPHDEAGEAVTPITRADLAGLPRGDQGKRLLELYAPTVRALLATFDFLDDDQDEDTLTLKNVNEDPANNNPLLLDLNNGYNPSDLDNLPVCNYLIGCATQFPAPDPAPFVARTNATVIYGSDQPTVGIVNAWDGAERSTTLYPLDADRFRPGAGHIWWEDDRGDSPVRPTAPIFHGDATVPVIGAMGIFQRDLRVRAHQVVAERSSAPDDPAALVTGPSVDTSHTGLLAAHRVQRLILSRLGQVERDARFVRPSSTDLFELFGGMITFWNDPAEVVLVDVDGRRAGWTVSTGPLTEIPGSGYLGGAEGFGWIPAEAVEGEVELQIRGLGEDHLVVVTVDTSEASFEIVSQGWLDMGEERVLPVDPPPDRSSWQNPQTPEDVNGDEAVKINDLLLLVAYLREPGDDILPEPPQTPPPYYDVNGDGRATIADLLKVVAALRTAHLQEGEAEAHEPAIAPLKTPLLPERRRTFAADAAFAQFSWQVDWETNFEIEDRWRSR